MKILGIESSCDETACAVVEDGRKVLSNIVATSLEEHKLYGGVVPEIASRRHAESISGVVKEALEKADCTIDTEFPYYNEQFQYIVDHTHTAYIVQAHKQTQQKLIEISSRFPFPSIENFKTNFFDKKYDVIFLSLLTSAHTGLYINKEDGTYVVFGFSNVDITNPDNWEKVLENVPKEFHETNLIELRKFCKNYIFAGEAPVKEIISNLEYIKQNLSPKTKLVLILGSEKECSKTLRGYENLASRHALINREVEKFAQRNNVDTINLTGLIESDDDYTSCINHFERKVYLKLGNLCAGFIHS